MMVPLAFPAGWDGEVAGRGSGGGPLAVAVRWRESELEAWSWLDGVTWSTKREGEAS